jgi:hypothetical protein
VKSGAFQRAQAHSAIRSSRKKTGKVGVTQPTILNWLTEDDKAME